MSRFPKTFGHAMSSGAIPRRQVLRGLGAAVALPCLASFREAGAARAAVVEAGVPTRMAFL